MFVLESKSPLPGFYTFVKIIILQTVLSAESDSIVNSNLGIVLPWGTHCAVLLPPMDIYCPLQLIS